MVAIQAANVEAVMYIRVSYTSAIKVMGTPAKPMGQKLSVQIAPVQLLFPSVNVASAVLELDISCVGGCRRINKAFSCAVKTGCFCLKGVERISR